MKFPFFGSKKGEEDTSPKNKKKDKDKAKETSPKIKPSESLGTVLDESVPAASLEIIRRNEAFHYSDAKDGRATYIVATIDVADIGGLNKHMKNDPDKGQFIEQITNREIEAHVSEEGIEAGKFVIIPSEKSLRSLTEFSFISDSGRFSKFIPTFVYVDDNGNMEFKEIDGARVDFKWFVDIIKHRETLENQVERAINMAGGDSISGLVTGVEPSKDSASEGTENTEGVEASAVQEEPVSMASQIQPSEPEPAPAPAPVAEEVQPVADAPSDDNIYKDEIPGSDSGYDEDDSGASQIPNVNFMDDNTDDNNLVECPNCHGMMNINEPCPYCGFELRNDGDGTEADEEGYAENEDGDIEIPEDDITAAFERVFHAGDLDLQITPQPFDVQFVKGNDFIPISEDRGDGWLNRYVTQLVKNANAELKQLHKQNLFLTRERYITLMTKACERIAAKVDINDSSNPYYDVKRRITEAADKRKAGLEREISDRKTAMQEEWEKELQRIKESAAAAKEREYREHNAKAHEAALRNIETMLNDEVEVEYARNITELNERRKTEAKRMLDIATTETLIVMSEDYKTMLEEEDARRQEFLREIQQYIDEHRKDEIARTEVLNEELQQKDIATKVTEEFARKIQTLSFEHDATCDKLHQEIETSRKHEETVKKESALKINELTAKLNDSESKYQSLMDKYVQIEAIKSKEYEGRMTTLENDKKAAEEHLAHVDLIHNKYNKVAIVVWAAIAVATFAIGLLVGSKFLGTQITPAGNNHVSISFEAEDEANPTEGDIVVPTDEDESLSNQQ